ncbi:MAG: response regulator [bacterium]
MNDTELLQQNNELKRKVEDLSNRLRKYEPDFDGPQGPAEAMGAPFAQRKRIAVIIDDSKLIHIRYKSIIEGHGIIVVATSQDGTFGADLVLTHRPRLVILDYNMPGVNGSEVARMIRDADNQVKIIVISGYLDADRIALLKSSGVDEILVKPINEQKFGEALRRMEI